MASGLPAFIDQVPDYNVYDGRMHISMGDFVLVMPISVFTAGCIKGEAAIAKWQLKQMGYDRRVIPMPKR